MVIVLRRYDVSRDIDRAHHIDVKITGVKDYFVISDVRKFKKRLPKWCVDPNGLYYVIVFVGGYVQILPWEHFDVFRKYERDEKI